MSKSIIQYLSENSPEFKHRVLITKDRPGKVVGMKTGEHGITNPIPTKISLKQNIDQKSKDDLEEMDSPITVTKSVASN